MVALDCEERADTATAWGQTRAGIHGESHIGSYPSFLQDSDGWYPLPGAGSTSIVGCQVICDANYPVATTLDSVCVATTHKIDVSDGTTYCRWHADYRTVGANIGGSDPNTYQYEARGLTSTGCTPDTEIDHITYVWANQPATVQFDLATSGVVVTNPTATLAYWAPYTPAVDPSNNVYATCTLGV